MILFYFSFFKDSQTASQKCKILHTALKISVQCIDQLKKTDKSDENINKHITILKQFESLLQTTLKHLIQISLKKKNDAETITNLKHFYSRTLQTTIDREDFVIFSQHILNTLQTIYEFIQ